MTGKKLTDYVKSALEKDMSIEKIKDVLTSSGWLEDEIDETLTEAQCFKKAINEEKVGNKPTNEKKREKTITKEYTS